MQTENKFKIEIKFRYIKIREVRLATKVVFRGTLQSDMGQRLEKLAGAWYEGKGVEVRKRGREGRGTGGGNEEVE